MRNAAYKERHRAKKMLVRAQRHLQLNEYKTQHGCADCGYSKCAAALEFDHRPGEQKLGNIGEWVGKDISKLKWDALSREIAKCDVVCANCHRERHVLRSSKTAGGEGSASEPTPVSAPSDFQALLQAARGEGPGISYPLCLADDVWRGFLPPTGLRGNYHGNREEPSGSI